MANNYSELTTIVSPSELRGDAKSIKALASQEGSTIERIKKLANKITETWTGEAASAYLAQLDKLQKSYIEYKSKLEYYASGLETIASNMETGNAGTN